MNFCVSLFNVSFVATIVYLYSYHTLVHEEDGKGTPAF